MSHSPSSDTKTLLRQLEQVLEARETSLKQSTAREATLLHQLEHILETSETSIRRLTAREATLMDQVATLERQMRVMKTDASALNREHQHLTNREKELVAEVSRLSEQGRDAEERARTFEAQCDELKGKADRHDRLEIAGGKLIVELDRLPLSMDKAGIIPGAARPEIALYGTYDWQNVMDAKFALMQAMRKEES